MPMVSVIMSNYNTPEPYLRQAIESILNQTFEDFEFIIADDGSLPEVRDVIESYTDRRIVLLPDEGHWGLCRMLNRGIDAARGKYIARMDSDDIAHRRRIEKQVAYMESHPDIDVLAARAQNFGDRKGLSACLKTDPERVKMQFFFGCAINHPSTMLRASFLEQHNLRYNEDFLNSEDYLLWTQIALIGKISEYPEVLLYYRRHSRQVSVYDRIRQIEYSNLVRRIWLSELELEPTPEETWVHYGLCIGMNDGDEIPSEYHFTLSQLEEWCEKLIVANEKLKLFDCTLFRTGICCSYIVVAVKSGLKRRKLLSTLFGHAFIKRCLRPSVFLRVAGRGIYSLRVKQLFSAVRQFEYEGSAAE